MFRLYHAALVSITAALVVVRFIARTRHSVAIRRLIKTHLAHKARMPRRRLAKSKLVATILIGHMTGRILLPKVAVPEEECLASSCSLAAIAFRDFIKPVIASDTRTAPCPKYELRLGKGLCKLRAL